MVDNDICLHLTNKIKALLHLVLEKGEYREISNSFKISKENTCLFIDLRENGLLFVDGIFDITIEGFTIIFRTNFRNTSIDRLPPDISDRNVDFSSVEHAFLFIRKDFKLDSEFSLLNLEEIEIEVNLSKKSQLEDLMSKLDFPSLKSLRIHFSHKTSVLSFETILRILFTKFRYVNHLRIGDNYTELPDCFDIFDDLKSLMLQNYGYRKAIVIPQTILSLDQLEILEFYKFRLHRITEDFSNLINIRRLGFCQVTIHNINDIENIAYLPNLTELELSFCMLKRIPSFIFSLSGLKSLYLFGNKNIYIQEEIRNMKSLSLIDLNRCQLSSFPDALYLIIDSLDSINLKRNDSIDREFLKHPKIREIVII